MADSYIESINRYREALRAALVIAEDVFKAPEQVVETAPAVVQAAWNMQVEYAALYHGRRNTNVHG